VEVTLVNRTSPAVEVEVRKKREKCKAVCRDGNRSSGGIENLCMRMGDEIENSLCERAWEEYYNKSDRLKY
jgi:hypothetical protein